MADKDLNLIILRLVQCYKQQMILGRTWQKLFAMKVQDTNAADLQIAESSVRPPVDREFERVEQRLQDGEEPLFVLRDFLFHRQ